MKPILELCYDEKGEVFMTTPLNMRDLSEWLLLACCDNPKLGGALVGATSLILANCPDARFHEQMQQFTIATANRHMEATARRIKNDDNRH